MKKLSFLIVMAFLAGSFSTPAEAKGWKFWQKKKEEVAEEQAAVEPDSDTEEAAPAKPSRFSSFKRSMSKRLQRSKSSPNLTAASEEAPKPTLQRSQSEADLSTVTEEARLSGFDLIKQYGMENKTSFKDRFASCGTTDKFVKMLSAGKAGPGTKCRTSFCDKVCAGKNEAQSTFTKDLCLGACVKAVPLKERKMTVLAKRFGPIIQDMPPSQYEDLVKNWTIQLGEKQAKLFEKDAFVSDLNDARVEQKIAETRMNQDRLNEKAAKSSDKEELRILSDISNRARSYATAVAKLVNEVPGLEKTLGNAMRETGALVMVRQDGKNAQISDEKIANAVKDGIASAAGIHNMKHMGAVKKAMKSPDWNLEEPTADNVKEIYQSFIDKLLTLPALKDLQVKVKMGMTPTAVLAVAKLLGKKAPEAPAVGEAPAPAA